MAGSWAEELQRRGSCYLSLASHSSWQKRKQLYPHLSLVGENIATTWGSDPVRQQAIKSSHRC